MYICQICKKAPASIHLTDIKNQVKKEMHLCEACAKEKGFNLQDTANLPQLLGLAAQKGAFAQAGKKPPAAKPAKPAKPEEADVACPACGLTWKDFNDRGRLGCPEDYRVFGERLLRLVAAHLPVRTAARATLHVGKRPGAAAPAAAAAGRGIRSLERRLREAVAEENYEQASALKAELDALRLAVPGKAADGD
ncbi:MAG: UvrB/UvrC motif-containing protein [Planctomycetota bacterium]|jgi:protein arginine kinase activator|nr:UvrB/UvrC motif-containing protein [Planctomycetota bacterium]